LGACRLEVQRERRDGGRLNGVMDVAPERLTQVHTEAQ
jgi:hypothetical protein